MAINVVNLSPSSWQITIGDAPTILDLSPAVKSFEIGHPLAEIKTPLTWSGQMVLSERLVSSAAVSSAALTESIDDEINPGRWEMGAHPIRLYINGLHILTCRIGDDYAYNEVTREAAASLTDKLGLIDREHPSEPLADEFDSRAQKIQVGNSGALQIGVLPWPEFARHILRQSQTKLVSPILSPADLLTDGLDTSLKHGRSRIVGQPSLDGYSAAQYDASGSPARAIQEVFLLRQRWVWCNKNEQIDNKPYPIDLGTNPIAAIALEDLIAYERLPSPDPVKANSISVGGTGVERDTSGDVGEDGSEPWPKIFVKLGSDVNEDGDPIPGSEVELERKQVDKPAISRSGARWTKRQRERVWQSKGSAFPDQHAGSNTQFLRDDLSRIIRYDDEGFPLSATESTLTARGTLNYELFEDDTNLVEALAVESWRYNDRKQPISYRRQRQVPAFAITDSTESSNPRTSELEVIDWESIGVDSVRQVRLVWKAYGQGEGQEPFELVLDAGASGTELLPAPPAPPMLDASEAIKVFRRSITVRSSSSTPSDLPPEVYELNYVNNDEVLQNAGELILTLKRQRERRRRTTHAWIAALADYRPFRRIDLHTGAFVIDGLQIQIAEGSGVQVSYSANKVGTIPAVVKPKIELATTPGTPVTEPSIPPYVPPTPVPHYAIEFEPPGAEVIDREPGYDYVHAPDEGLTLETAASELGVVSWAFPLVLERDWSNLTLEDWIVLAG